MSVVFDTNLACLPLVSNSDPKVGKSLGFVQGLSPGQAFVERKEVWLILS